MNEILEYIFTRITFLQKELDDYKFYGHSFEPVMRLTDDEVQKEIDELNKIYNILNNYKLTASEGFIVSWPDQGGGTTEEFYTKEIFANHRKKEINHPWCDIKKVFYIKNGDEIEIYSNSRKVKCHDDDLNMKNVELIEKIKNKLTPEERKALGL
jgi:hypothetical protein